VITTGIVAGSAFLVGCASSSTSSILEDIEKWIPVGEDAVNGIISLLQGAGLITPPIQLIITAIETGFSDLATDIQSYENLNPPPTTVPAKIDAVLSLLIQNIQALLSQANIGGPLVVIIGGLAQVILSTIAGFLNKVTTVAQLRSAKLLTGQLKIGKTTVSYVPQARTIGRFKKDYNAVAKANGHPEIELKLSFWERF